MFGGVIGSENRRRYPLATPRQLPDCGRTQVQLTGFVFEQVSYFRCQPLRFADGPEECVAVEQQAPAHPRNSSNVTGSSQPGSSLISPRANPSCLAPLSALFGTTLATGLPLRVSTISSPVSSTCSRIWDRCVLHHRRCSCSSRGLFPGVAVWSVFIDGAGSLSLATGINVIMTKP